MEDIIALSIIAIFLLAVIVGAVLLRRRVVRRRSAKLKQQWEITESLAKRSRELEQWKAVEISRSYLNTGSVGEQRYDPKTGTIRTAVRDTKTNGTQYVSTPVTSAATAQSVNNSGPDLLTVMTLAGVMSSLNSSPSYSKPSTDFGLDDSDSRKSSSSSFGSSDSSSSWSDSSSSDSGSSSDW